MTCLLGLDSWLGYSPPFSFENKSEIIFPVPSHSRNPSQQDEVFTDEFTCLRCGYTDEAFAFEEE